MDASLAKSYELVFGKLDEERAERVYREFSVMATALRVPPEKWPKDREAFKVYWDEMISNLIIPEEAKGIAKDVLGQTGLPWGFTWLYATVKGPISRIITTEMLPEHVRNEFGMPSTPYTRQMFRLITSFNAAVVPYLPVSVREFPKTYYMKGLRRRNAMGLRM